MHRTLVCTLLAGLLLAVQARCWDRKDLFGSNSVAGGYMIMNPPGYTDEVWDRMAQMGVTSSRMAASRLIFEIPREPRGENGLRAHSL